MAHWRNRVHRKVRHSKFLAVRAPIIQSEEEGEGCLTTKSDLKIYAPEGVHCGFL